MPCRIPPSIPPSRLVLERLLLDLPDDDGAGFAGLERLRKGGYGPRLVRAADRRRRLLRLFLQAIVRDIDDEGPAARDVEMTPSMDPNR